MKKWQSACSVMYVFQKMKQFQYLKAFLFEIWTQYLLCSPKMSPLSMGFQFQCENAMMNESP